MRATAVDRLRPRALGLTRIVRAEPRDRGAPDRAFLESAARRGLLFEIWPDVFVAADLPRGAALRAEALAALVPDGAVVAREAAFWVHTGLARPAEVDVVHPTLHRVSGIVRPHADRLAPQDVSSLGGLLVTTPARTAVDLARTGDPRAAAERAAALAALGLTAAEVLAALGRVEGFPGARRARAALAGLGPAWRDPAPADVARAGTPN